MPLYEYECQKCHHRVERIQKFSDPHMKKCPDCGSPVELVVSAPAVQFKGSGWYVTDYAKKSSAPSSSNGDSGPKTDSDSKSDSGKSESESKNDSDMKSEDSRAKKNEKGKQESSPSSSSSSKKSEKKSSSRDKS